MLQEKQYIQLLSIILVGIFIYANSFNVPLVFDDFDYIVNNPAIKDFSYFLDHSRLAELPLLQDVKNNFFLRPVTYLTFALNYRLHGLDLFGYHLVNILIHVANALLLYRFFGLTLRTPYMVERLQGRTATPRLIGYLPLFAALLFVSHPLQTQAVTYIIQRFVSLSTFFIFGALVLYAEARLAGGNYRRRALFVASFLSLLLAMKTKGIAFTLPIIMLLFEFMFFSGDIKRRVVRLLPFLAAMSIIPWAVISLATARHSFSTTLLRDPTNLVNFDSVSRWDYLMTQFWSIATYLRLLIFPVQQNFYYDSPVVHCFWLPEVMLPLFLHAALFGGALFLWRRAVNREYANPWHRLISFGILWFYVTLSVESSIIPIEDVLVEHRVYLPSCGFFLALCGGIGLLHEKRPGFSMRCAWWGILLVVAVLCVATVKRNLVWADNVILWQDVVRKSPHSDRAYDHLGFWLTSAGRNEEAVVQLRKGLELAPGNFKLRMHLGTALINLNRLEEAAVAFQQATAIKPGNSMAHANLATTYFKMGDLLAGSRAMGKAVELNPKMSGELHMGLGIALLNQNQYEEALATFRQAIAINPDDPQAHNNLATTYLMMGDVVAGRRSLLKALALDPDYGSAHYNLGCLLEKEGKFAEALAEMKKALRSNDADASLQSRIVRLRESIVQEGLR